MTFHNSISSVRILAGPVEFVVDLSGDNAVQLGNVGLLEVALVFEPRRLAHTI